MDNDKPKTMQRMIAILDCFSSDQPELGVREIARQIGFSRSTTGRLLQGLKELNLLQQNPGTLAYSLGGKVLAWAGVYLSRLDVRDVALPAMQELHRITRETISLYVMEGNERVCVERLESPQNVRIVARVGRRIPLYAGSAGKVFLAYLPLERCKAVLRETPPTAITDFTIVNREKLMDELAKIRTQGYSVSFGEWTADAAGVAAPIFGTRGEVIAAVTISGPIARFTEEVVQRYTPDITRMAASISREMGFTGKKPIFS
jgi:DNA-binding IclR family transcriptional regulator